MSEAGGDGEWEGGINDVNKNALPWAWEEREVKAKIIQKLCSIFMPLATFK